MASSPTAAMERQSNNVPGSAACDGLPCSGPFSAMALDPKRSICAAGEEVVGETAAAIPNAFFDAKCA